MSNVLKYSLVRYQPHISRHEVVNIGVVLFTPDGPVLEVAGNLQKIRSLDPNLPLSKVTSEVNTLEQTLKALWSSAKDAESVVAFLSHGKTGAGCMPVGMVAIDNRSTNELLSDLMRDLVLPPTRQRQKQSSHSRLHAELKQVFNQAKLLGKTPGDIANHLVVPNFPIDADVGLFAEFALRNGRLHVTETVDFRVKDLSSKKREAESKALVLLQALETVGKDDLKRHVVVSGADSEAVQPSLNLLSRYADDVFVRESQQDWTRYLDLMAKAAQHRPDLPH